MDNLPIIITGSGTYKTRNGKKVTIHGISDKGETFAAKGSIWRHPNKIGMNPRYEIWHISGRRLPLKEDNLDIIEKIA